MENYEQKYKDALERAQSIRQGKCEESFLYNQGLFEYLFPELKESEDENIRKAILELVKQSSDILNPMNQKSMIAWLEKQSEQKSVDNLRWNELTWEDINTLEGIINNVHYEFRNGIGAESFGEEVLERFREIKGDEYMDKCEQNPAEDEDREYACQSSEHYTRRELMIYNLGIANGKKMIEDAINETKQNLTVWSEEDGRMFTKIEEAIKSYYAPFSKEAEEMLNWFKSVKDRIQPQPKQEWSEEDGAYLNIIIEDLKELYKKRKADPCSVLGKSQRDNIDWLKSFKERLKGE